MKIIIATHNNELTKLEKENQNVFKNYMVGQNEKNEYSKIDRKIESIKVIAGSQKLEFSADYFIDTTGDGIADDGSLRGSSEVVASRIKDEIQKKVDEAGIEIIDARITYLAYATEIAAVMLQRQQASAIIDARKMIVDGAVGMVEMALERLSQNDTVKLDEERKAAMVSNLLVVLCGNKDAQPIVNSGSLY